MWGSAGGEGKGLTDQIRAKVPFLGSRVEGGQRELWEKQIHRLSMLAESREYNTAVSTISSFHSPPLQQWGTRTNTAQRENFQGYSYKL